MKYWMFRRCFTSFLFDHPSLQRLCLLVYYCVCILNLARKIKHVLIFVIIHIFEQGSLSLITSIVQVTFYHRNISVNMFNSRAWYLTKIEHPNFILIKILLRNYRNHGLSNKMVGLKGPDIQEFIILCVFS